MKQLILARHAKSDWSQSLPDDQRPLNARGLKDAPAMGKLLADFGLRPDLIVSSHAVRALTTAQLVARELGHTQAIQIDRRIYLMGMESLLQVIRELPSEATSLMIFGHNPDMEQTLAHLLKSGAYTPMPTCAMASLTLSGGWNTISLQTHQLNWFLLPKLIRGS
jgi:phosphohistidine phosphatase